MPTKQNEVHDPYKQRKDHGRFSFAPAQRKQAARAENKIRFSGSGRKTSNSAIKAFPSGKATTARAMSASYIKKFCTTIRGIFRAAVQDGVIIRTPADLAKPPEGTNGEHRCLEEWEQNLIVETCNEHDFGPCAMVMVFAGLRRGEALYLDIDRDVDFKKKTITVRGAVAFQDRNQPTETEGKTDAAQRVIPMNDILAGALKGRHGLLLSKQDGSMMTQASFFRKYNSYISFLETKVNGCHKRWYGKTKEHKALLEEGKRLPPWRNVKIR